MVSIFEELYYLIYYYSMAVWEVFYPEFCDW